MTRKNFIVVIAAFYLAVSTFAVGQNFPSAPTPPPLTGCFPFTPQDVSGEGLSPFTNVNVQYCQINNIAFVYGSFTYPTATDSNLASFSLPISPAANYGSVSTPSGSVGTGIQFLRTVAGTAAATVWSTSGVQATNTNMSAATVHFMFNYPVH